MNYRISILDRLYRAAERAQNVGRWELADTYISMGRRYETLWAALDAALGAAHLAHWSRSRRGASSSHTSYAASSRPASTNSHPATQLRKRQIQVGGFTSSPA